jgi:hypothetical protein
MQLLASLLAAGVPGQDIGIMSPYKAQVGRCVCQRSSVIRQHGYQGCCHCCGFTRAVPFALSLPSAGQPAAQDGG